MSKKSTKVRKNILIYVSATIQQDTTDVDFCNATTCPEGRGCYRKNECMDKCTSTNTNCSGLPIFISCFCDTGFCENNLRTCVPNP